MDFPRRQILLGVLGAPVAAAAGPAVPKRVLVYRQSGRFGGWPANHGIWSWGNEILVGFSVAWFQKREWMRHQMDSSKPEEPAFARSLDGGETWSVRLAPEQMLPRWGGKTGGRLDRAIDFGNPGFAMTMRFNDVDTGPTVCWYSEDKGQAWRGPFEFPDLGLKGIAGRPNYLVLGKSEALAFLTCAKSDKQEGRPFCARTRDGGLTWQFVSYLGEEPPGFGIMPAAVILKDGTTFAAVRMREPATSNPQRIQRDWIQAYVSRDQGKTWSNLSHVADTGRGGNPASLIVLPDGRIVCAYGYRLEPYSMRARISRDGGRTWGDVITLRDGGKAPDLGYPRSILRPDGKIVTVYYFNDDVHNERFIEAVIWDPGTA